jgi:hypothetical protein
MNEREFIFWLKEKLDSAQGEKPSAELWDVIRHESSLIFNKIVPYNPKD